MTSAITQNCFVLETTAYHSSLMHILFVCNATCPNCINFIHNWHGHTASLLQAEHTMNESRSLLQPLSATPTATHHGS